MTFAYKISKWNRYRKWQIFMKEFRLKESLKVLDVGFSENEYWETDNYIEKHYPFPENLIAISIDTPNKIKIRYPKVKFMKYEGTLFPFEIKNLIYVGQMPLLNMSEIIMLN